MRRFSRVQVVVGVLVAALAIYLFLLSQRAAILIADPNFISKALGVVVLAFPVIGVYVVVQELRFGAATARLARAIGDEQLGRDDGDVEALPRSPAGRVARPAADALFARRQLDVEARPDDPVQWYRLALAYDLAGDRRRARRAMRQALALHTR